MISSLSVPSLIALVWSFNFTAWLFGSVERGLKTKY